MVELEEGEATGFLGAMRKLEVLKQLLESHFLQELVEGTLLLQVLKGGKGMQTRVSSKTFWAQYPDQAWHTVHV